MNIYDLIILITVVAGFGFGIFKGFVREAMSLLSIVLGWVLAEMFNHKVTPYIEKIINTSGSLTTIISYILIFIATVVVLLSIAKMIEKLFSKLHLSWFNSLLGGIFGAFKWAIIASIVFNIFDALDSKFNFVNQQIKSESVVYFPTLRLSPTLWEQSKHQYDFYKKENQENEKNRE